MCLYKLANQRVKVKAIASTCFQTKNCNITANIYFFLALSLVRVYQACLLNVAQFYEYKYIDQYSRYIKKIRRNTGEINFHRCNKLNGGAQHTHTHIQSAIIVYRWMMKKVSHKEYTTHFFFQSWTCAKEYVMRIACYRIILLHFRFQVSFTAPSKTLSLDWRIEEEGEIETLWKTFTKHCPQFILIDMIDQYRIRAHLCC